MKTQIIWALSLVLTSINVSGQNITEANSEKTQSIINSVLDAYGGREALQNMETLLIESSATGYAVGQSRAPGPPWDRTERSTVSAIDVSNQRFFSRNIDDPKRARFDQGQIFTSDSGWQINYRAGTITPIDNPDFNTRSGPFVRITSTLLAHQLMQRAHTATYLGETDYKNKPHDVVSFVMEVGPAISLYVDQSSHLINKSERFLPAFGLVEYEFRDYRAVNGIMVNHGYTFYFQGDENEIRTHKSVSVNSSIEDFIKKPKGLKKLGALGPDDMSRQEVAKDAHLIGGNGTYALYVEMDDHIIAVGGTGGSEERLVLLREAIPDKPIKYGIFTHHHSDHVLAAPSYARIGTTLVAHADHEQTVRTAAGEVDDLKIETVSSRRTFGDGSREVMIVDLGPTEHAEHIFAAYLPEERILFSADHFGLQRNGHVFPATGTTRQFAAAMEREGLDVKKILSAHSPKTATIKHLRKALSSKPRSKDSF
ncbi:MAG: MBL fold metallo-hydrolase [Gammaproteobacteria bacterium]